MKMDRLEEIIRTARLSPEEFGALPEGKRLAIVRAAGTVPADCSPVPEAPARGVFQVFTPMKAYPKGEDGWEWKPAGHDGRRVLRIGDAFDVMAAQAMRRKQLAPFSPGQIAIGRHYRALVEKRECAGLKCSSIEGRQGGGGTGGGFMDAVLEVRREIDLLHRRIGDRPALAVRRIRPSARAGGVVRGQILDRALVDLVCLEEKTLSDVLGKFGWTAKGEHIKALRAALCAALDRMNGPAGTREIMVMRA